MSQTNEALKIWEALKPMINRQIEEKTRSCVRSKKMIVTSAPNGSVIGVAEPWGEEILIPYLSTLSGAVAGDAVWVWYYYGNASNMIAMTMGDGQIPIESESFDTVPVSGATPSIVAEADTCYECGEVATLSVLVPADGDVEIFFTSGSTPTVLTITSAKPGVTDIKWPIDFDPSSLNANTVYDLIISRGEYGVAASWQA